MHRLNNLVPGFLKRFDTWLLEHAPAIWVTRVHYVAFFGGIVGSLVMLRSMFTPIELADLPNLELHGALIAIPAVIVGILWTIRQAVFVSGKNYGIESPGIDLVKVLIYAGIFAGFIMITPAYQLTLQDRIGDLVTDQEFSEDMLALEEGVILFNGRDGENSTMHFYYSTYTEPSYIPYAEDGSLIIPDLPKKVVKERLSDFSRVFTKYGGDLSDIDMAEVMKGYDAGTGHYLPYAEQREVFDNIWLIAEIKEGRGVVFQHEAWQAFSFMAFAIAFALVVFSRVRWNYFVVAVIATAALGVAGLIADFGIAAISGFRAEGGIWLLFTFTALMFMGIQSLSVFGARKFTWARTIGTVGLSLIFPLLPLYFIGAMEIIGMGGFSDSDIWIALWGGVAIHLLVGVHFFKEALTRLEAIPK